MIKNVIFDIGNVLVSFGWREYLSGLGYSPEMVERVGRATVESEYWKEYDRGTWSDDTILEKFIQNDREIEEYIRQACDNFEGMCIREEFAIPWIQEIKGKGRKVYVLSNFSRKAHIECSKALDFMEYIDGGIMSYQDQLIKPDAAIYQLILNRYHMRPEETVFLDDIKENIEAAQKEGMHVIHVKNHEQAYKDLNSLLDEVE